MEKLKKMEQSRPIKEKTSHIRALEKTETVDEKKKSMLNEMMDLSAEVLVKIFNFLPNYDIRCGVSMACKKFHEICQDESLVPVKDLGISQCVKWAIPKPHLAQTYDGKKFLLL